MKHLRKFEELDYNTYVTTSDKLHNLGQKERAKKVRIHGAEMEKRKIEQYRFDILVGESKVFKNAEFISLNVLREKTAYSIVCHFLSESNNTHRVCATIESDGTITWRDYNKFADRKSVNNFLIILKALANYQPDFVSMLSEMGITTEQLKISARTFYI